MPDEPVVDWKPEAQTAPREGRQWGRALAVVLGVVALILVSLRVMARLPGATANEAGQVVGGLIVGPILFGAVIWAAVAFSRRRSGRNEKFLSAGLVAWIAALAILATFGSVGR
jgi:hypothetical protein